MTGPNKLDQAHREVERAQERLRDLEQEKGDAERIRDLGPAEDGGLSAEARYSIRKYQLERELEKAEDAVRRAETEDTSEADAGPNAAFITKEMEQGAGDKMAKDAEVMLPAARAAPEDHGGLQGVVSPTSPDAPPRRDVFDELVFDRPPESPKVPETVDAVPVTPERQAHPPHGSGRQAHAPHGQPARQSETAKSDPTSDAKPADREEQMAQRNAEINARVKAGAPVKPWNPVFVAKRAKSLSRAAKQKAAAAAIAAIIVSVGVCATSANAPARPEAAGATAAPAAGEEFIPTAQPVRSLLPAATAAPIGATIVVTPVVSYGGGCSASQRLEPKTVSNPPVGASQSYEWQVEWPSCSRGLSRSWGIDHPRPALSQPQTLFPPRTTYAIKPLGERSDVCSLGSCRELMVVTVTNEGQ